MTYSIHILARFDIKQLIVSYVLYNYHKIYIRKLTENISHIKKYYEV